MPIAGYRKASDLPGVIPVFPLDGAILLPDALLPLQIFEPRYLNMIDDAMAGGRLIGMIQTADGGTRTRPALARVGCAGRITRYSETSDGRYLIALTGLCRFSVIEEIEAVTPYRQVRADFARFETDLQEDGPAAFPREPFLARLRAYLDSRHLGVEWEAIDAAPSGALVNSLCMALPFTVAEKQALLEADTLDARRAVLEAILEIDAAAGEADDDAPSSLQ
jgi:uncharacterized protein